MTSLAEGRIVSTGLQATLVATKQTMGINITKIIGIREAMLNFGGLP
ncbi:hypothetical protein ACE38W_11020 [Chitinophaga sp. Hz27]